MNDLVGKLENIEPATRFLYLYDIKITWMWDRTSFNYTAFFTSWTSSPLDTETVPQSSILMVITGGNKGAEMNRKGQHFFAFN